MLGTTERNHMLPPYDSLTHKRYQLPFGWTLMRHGWRIWSAQDSNGLGVMACRTPWGALIGLWRWQRKYNQRPWWKRN